MSTAGTIYESLSRIPAEGGKLRHVSATALSFKPFNGSTIKINGALYEIPAAGIVGLANTGIRVNGVAGQNLATGTRYYVYAFVNAGVLTADFSTTGHSTSTAAGNVGTEIKTGDDTRSLIGMVRTNASAQFVNTVKSRLVISWFNRGEISLLGSYDPMQQASITSGFYDLVANAIELVTWDDEAININVNGWMANNTVSYCFLSARWDGAGQLHASIYNYDVHNVTTYLMSMGQVNGWVLAEGYHYITPAVMVGGGLGSFYAWAGAMTRG